MGLGSGALAWPPRAASHCLPLPPTLYHYLPFSPTVFPLPIPLPLPTPSHCLPFPPTAYYSLPLPPNPSDRLPITTSHFLLLTSHCLTLLPHFIPTFCCLPTASHFLPIFFPLLPVASHCPPTAPKSSHCLPIASHCPSNPPTASHCLPLPSNVSPPLATIGASIPFPLAPPGQSPRTVRHSNPTVPCKTHAPAGPHAHVSAHLPCPQTGRFPAACRTPPGST